MNFMFVVEGAFSGVLFAIDDVSTDRGLLQGNRRFLNFYTLLVLHFEFNQFVYRGIDRSSLVGTVVKRPWLKADISNKM